MITFSLPTYASLLLRPPVATLPTAHAAALRHAYEAHDAEIASHAEIWGPVPADGPPPLPQAFADDDFRVVTSIDERYAGPDASSLIGGSLVHETSQPVVSAGECDALLADVQAVLSLRASNPVTYGQGQGDTLNVVPEVERRVVHVSQLHGHGAGWMRQKLRSTFFPMLASRYGVDAADLAVSDALVVGYDAAANATHMPAHRDAALMTINVALSDEADYREGGTLIEASRAVVRMPRGHAACHASGVRHAGHPITAGTRWVLVIFVVARSVPQLAWRCAERAAAAKVEAQEAMRANADAGSVVAALETAAECLGAATALAPRDHEFLHAMAGLLMLTGDETGARQYARRAAEAYPPCPKPKLALGALLLGAGRTRGALRQFERALGVVLRDDDDDAWAARCNGALCVVRLLQQHGRSPTPLSTATVWLRDALAAAPEDARLLELGGEVAVLARRGYV